MEEKYGKSFWMHADAHNKNLRVSKKYLRESWIKSRLKPEINYGFYKAR